MWHQAANAAITWIHKSLSLGNVTGTSYFAHLDSNWWIYGKIKAILWCKCYVIGRECSYKSQPLTQQINVAIRMTRHFETSVAKRLFLHYPRPHCELQQKINPYFYECPKFGRFSFESAELFEIKHPRGLNRVKAEVWFYLWFKQTGWGEYRGDNKRRNRGRSFSLFSKAIFPHRQCTPNPKMLKTKKCFFWNGA